jgi:hypothetical protein
MSLVLLVLLLLVLLLLLLFLLLLLLLPLHLTSSVLLPLCPCGAVPEGDDAETSDSDAEDCNVDMIKQGGGCTAGIA